MIQVFDKDTYTTEGRLSPATRTAKQFLNVGLYNGTHTFNAHTQQMELGGTETNYIEVSDYEYSVQESYTNPEFFMETADVSIGVGTDLTFNSLVARVAESLAVMKVSLIPRGVVDTERFGGVVKQCTTVASPDWSLLTSANTKRCGPHSATCDLLIKTTPVRTSTVRVKIGAEDTSVHDLFNIKAIRLDVPHGISNGGK